MIRSVVFALLSLVFGNLLFIIVTDWSFPVKVLGRGSKQQYCAVDVSETCRPACPPWWLNYEGKCYFFSEEEENWTSSQSFCASHGSSLAVIETETEKAFVQNFGCSFDHWIGLQKEPGQTWKWVDGTELNNGMEVKGEAGGCAFLDSDSVVSSSCHRIRRWICSHHDIYTKKGSIQAQNDLGGCVNLYHKKA